jgi:hypothetical protein
VVKKTGSKPDHLLHPSSDIRRRPVWCADFYLSNRYAREGEKSFPELFGILWERSRCSNKLFNISITGRYSVTHFLTAAKNNFFAAYCLPIFQVGLNKEKDEV